MLSINSQLSARLCSRLREGLTRQLGALALAAALLVPSAALAQQQGAISGKVTDPDGLALPGATVTIKGEATGYSRTYTTAATGEYKALNLQPGHYILTAEMSGFTKVSRQIELTSGMQATNTDLKLKLAGLAEEVTVEGEAPLVETSSNKIGGTLSRQEIEDVPSNFRNFTALTQLIPGMTPAPATSSFEGGQITANGSPAQSNVYLLDGAYNNDDRLGGSQGTQVRVVLDNIGEYQVLSNQYSAEYGGGAGAIVNMVSRSGTNDFSGRVYTYFRDESLNSRNAFLPADQPKPAERTIQAGFGLGGPIVKNKAHFYFTVERDDEDQAVFKNTLPAAGGALTAPYEALFEVKALNTFFRLDYQPNSSNFISFRALREKAPTKGEDITSNEATNDAKVWEGDLDEMMGLNWTSTISDRASNVFRFSAIHEQLDTGAETYFEETTSFGLGDSLTGVGLNGRDPFSVGQRNDHPGWIGGTGGNGTQTTIHTFVFDNVFSYFTPSLWGGEHTFKFGLGYSLNRADPQQTQSSGIFTFNSDQPYNPAIPSSYPTRFDVVVGPLGENGFAVDALDDRLYAFVADSWHVNNKLTLNLGLRYDKQKIVDDSNNIAPRVGFAYDLKGDGKTVIRGGGGLFFNYVPISIEIFKVRNGPITPFPTISVSAASDTCNCVLRPSLTTDSQGNPGIAALSPAGQADMDARRASVLAGTTFNRNPNLDDPNRKSPYQMAFSLGFSRELGKNAALTIDYVGNLSKDQMGVIDVNEPAINPGFAPTPVVRPGVAVFDPNGELVPAEARGTNYQRALTYTTRDELDGSYNSLQVAIIKRASNKWSGRLAYTYQDATYVGLGNPDNRRVWMDNDILADKGTFAANRTHVLAATATVTPWRTLSISGVVSALSGGRINETVGRDFNGDGDNNDRPIRDVSNFNTCRADGTVVGGTAPCTPGARVFYPILSDVDAQGRAVINGITAPGSLLVDMSFRYQIHLNKTGSRSLDLFYDIFNILNTKNVLAPSGNHASSSFQVENAAGFPRQMQLGARFRF